MTKVSKHLPHSLKDVENTPVGQGGMATIYKARQENLDRDVVIKKVKEELKNHPTIIKRFEREAKASARLIHQNLCHVYDYVTDEESPYIVMEYIDGVDVADILARRGSTPIDVALAIMMGVTRALAYIHSHGLVHRDIKPENIRISKTGDVKLMDFGIALKQAEESKLTLPGIIIGSPHYLSPEQVLGESIGPRSDLFSLGITLYELLTGSRPFDSAAQETVFYNIRKGIYKPARKLNRSIPRAVNNIIKKLLQPKPEKRFGSAWEVHRAIREYLDMDDERPFLRQYLIFESFVEPGPHEEVKPPKRSRPARIGPFLRAFVTTCIFGTVGWVTGHLLYPHVAESHRQNAPLFCIASTEDASFFSVKEQRRIRQIIFDQGYTIAGFPDLLKIKGTTPSEVKKYKAAFDGLPKTEQMIILQINQVNTPSKLFARRVIAWPKTPPCEHF